MKKILLFLSFLLMSIGVWSATYSLTPNNANTGRAETSYITSLTEFTYNGVSWKMNQWNPSTLQVKTNQSNAANEFRFYNTSAFSGKITQVVIKFSSLTVSDASKLMFIGGTSEVVTTTGGNAGTWNATTKTLTWTPAANTNYTYFAFYQNGKAASGTNNLANTDAIVITYDETSPSTYTVTYNANEGAGSMTDDNSPYDSGAIVTVLANTFTRDNYTFDRWNTAANGSGVYYDADDTFTITANTTLYAQWIENETPSSDPTVGKLVFELLTDINDLQDGDNIIILDAYNTYAMSTHQKTHNRDTTSAFDIVDNVVEILDNTKVQIIRVDSVKDDNNWEFFVGDGYLYASGNNAHNYLNTQSLNNADGQWHITLDNNSVATIIAQGTTNTYNLMQYNGGNGLFSCYRQNQPQTGLKIYRKVSCSSDYTVIFKNNGRDYDTTFVQSCLKRLTHLPSPPPNNIRCNNTAIFVGWSQYDVSNTNTKPTDLFQTVKRSPIIDSDKTFYAVFANVEVGSARDEEFELTLEAIDFSGFKYEDNNNEKTNIATSTNPLHDDTLHVKWTSYNVMRSKNEMQWKAKEGHIYNSTDLGCISNLALYDSNGTFTKYFGTSEKSTSYEDIGIDNGYFYILYTGDKAGKTSKISVIFTKNIIPKRYSNYTTYCIDTLQTEGNWNDSVNWKYRRVPEFNEAAVLLKPSTVNIPHATAKYVIINKTIDNTTKLTIGANKGLEVQDTISIHDGTYRATTPNDLVLESSSDGNASLIFNNNNNNQATVCLYSKATYPEGGNANWQYIGTTMTELNALYNYYDSWVYRWDGGWKVVHKGNMMYGWNGYCITQKEAVCHETSGQLVPTNNIVGLPIDSPYTVVANSWTAPIHINAFEDSDFDNLTDEQIYFFNTGFDPHGDGLINNTNAPGTYTVVPIHASPYIGDSLIPSQQGFFIKTTTNGTLKLNYNRLVRTNSNKDIIAGPLRSPKRTMSSDKPSVLKIYAHGSKFSDRLTILEHEDFSTGFDNGWDGDKMSLSDIAPSIYVVNEDGSFDEVSAIPDYEGTVLGFKNGSDNVCRLTFNYDGDDTWYLNDLATLTSTLISNDNDYTFTCDNTEGVRFIITATPYSGVNTDMEHNSDNSKSQKYFYNGNMYIIKNNRIFDTVGNLVK